MNFGTTEIILIVAVLFLLFGASRLPQLAKSLGQSRKAFKEGLREAEEGEVVDRVSAGSSAPRPQITEMSDADLEAEMKRRAAARAEH
ncbi:MAG: twin-arginine translocase TatA/TatE family subunit [Acidobacteria bacterium]|nr:twin-arginine translocase TatA/TatE family subunit [Acidobacteriota bacterium]